MAHSQETRVPFMDNNLVDCAVQCPVRLKLNNLEEVWRINENEPGRKQDKHFRRINDGRQILHDIMARYLLAYITRAEKQSLSPPDASWFEGVREHRLCGEQIR